MKEQVLIYSISESASLNATMLFFDEKYFYWNNEKFKNIAKGDYVFLVNKLHKYVLFAKLDKVDIKTLIDDSRNKTSFIDDGRNFEVNGVESNKLRWDFFVRFEIIRKLQIIQDWEWTNLGAGGTTYINGERINTDTARNRIKNINQLKQLTDDVTIFRILENCLLNFINEEGTNIIESKSKKNGAMASTNKEIIQHTYTYITDRGFQFQYEEIANFYLALCAKPFVILAGISGTGKTQLPRKFATSLGFSKDQVIQLPVRPDWTDGSDLLGYTSLDGNFIPKDLTIAIRKAAATPDKPFFFILDEMNLARVEHYFSDFLSVIETRERVSGEIKTDPILREEVLNLAKNKGDFSVLGWPQNLYLIGTVNMDETTHSFSRKVLDRANSIEMNEVDLNWININSAPVDSLSNITNALFQTPYLTASELSDTERNSITNEMELLQEVNKILQKADLHFAYRVRDEIAFYLILNKKHDLIESRLAFDFQLVQKILPRIHGSSERVQTVLVEILNLIEGKDFRSSNFEFSMLDGKIDIDNLKYRRASKKIIFMLKRFDDDRFTSFWL
jgi:AAA domain (dynein-related subfamily)